MYRVGVIGLGSIAAGYGTPDEAAPYCHVGGIRHSGRVCLAAVADLSVERQEKFRAKWGAAFPEVRYYASVDRMLDAERLDIVAVCVRGPHHFAVTREVLASSCRAVFLEKPPTGSLAELDELLRLARAKSVSITGSYSRHWTPHVLRLQQLVADGLIGEVRTVVGYAGGLLLSFASHTTDLLCQFGGYAPVTVRARGRVAPETAAQTPAGAGEPEPQLENLHVEFANGVVGFQVGAEGPHGSFYAEIFGTVGRVRAGMYVDPLVRFLTAAIRDPGGPDLLPVDGGQQFDFLQRQPRPFVVDQILSQPARIFRVQHVAEIAQPRNPPQVKVANMVVFDHADIHPAGCQLEFT